MKIVVINGSPRKNITYGFTQILKKAMKEVGEVEFVDYYLPQDAPCFCKGCFVCFFKGEMCCPDYQYIHPIVSAMEAADGIVMTSPVYVMQVSGGLKAFLDHLAYCYLNHRPRFFKQKAFVIVTTAGAGASNGVRYLKDNLRMMGSSKVYSFGKAVLAQNFHEIAAGRMAKYTKELQKKAAMFYEDIKQEKQYKPTFVQILMFQVGRMMLGKYLEDNQDKKYWMEQGFDEKGRRYFQKLPLGFLKQLASIMLSFFMRKS